MNFNPNVPHNDLRRCLRRRMWRRKPCSKRAISSNRALAELKGLGGVIPNPAMLVNTLVLQEAKASSEIENIVTTNDALFRAMASVRDRSIPRRKRSCVTAKHYGKGSTRCGKRRALAPTCLCTWSRSSARTERHSRQTRDGDRKCAHAGGDYTPPEGDKAIAGCSRSERFIHAKDTLDPLVKMALAHYQFEAIHPFFDGNGPDGEVDQHPLSGSQGVARPARALPEQVHH